MSTLINTILPIDRPVFLTSFAESTIFKRHETRNNRHPSQRARTASMTINAIDGTIGQTLARMNTRSTIFQLHSKRHEVLSQGRRVLPKMAPGDQYRSFSLADMTKTSSIYQRHARRAHLRQQA
eukprot:CAMPEP_0116848790 /NCGR_PEP_ID=MMETSP0418-20121206/15206_1 /TAXON_ID=1158023 /ORGANISM="Astrosyne radiata, Strain 13vi08-1A" /LENGTH=123 /DNA_ID=CAMNT_0004480427 /DNA_START=11 /DNA_END=382 /DNA_ORIENTATION=-